jgi:hypothetical protein
MLEKKIYLDNWELEEIVTNRAFVFTPGKGIELGYFTEYDPDYQEFIKTRIFAR